MSEPQLRLIEGGGDMVEVVGDLLHQIKEGIISGVVLCAITEEGGGTCGWTWAYRDGIPAPWARLVAGAAVAYHELVDNPLE